MRELIVDSFAGGGGASTGIELEVEQNVKGKALTARLLRCAGDGVARWR